MIRIIVLFFAFAVFSNCKNNSTSDVVQTGNESTAIVSAPDWSKNLSIYEVNIRQYTPEGTFKAFEAHLPRLKEMGFGILWLMPIHPIGIEKRKGSLGSYYSVKDYKAVNPDFGTLEGFQSLVKKAHDLGMYVILDWVANHSAWDNALVKTNPEYYTKDSTGKMIPPVADWSDVVDFNFDNKDLWNYQLEALRFWIEKADIDGYRCDVAGMVPLEFWQFVIPELKKIKPVFMLAEWESPEIHDKAFDMSYGWELHHIMNQIAKGEKNAADLYTYFEIEDQKYPQEAYRMDFITNHDENSWNGTVFERMGEQPAIALAVLSATAEQSMPLVYSGQEAGLDKRLKFFDKDEIKWKESPFNEVYSSLIKLKLNNEALWNGIYGGDVVMLSNPESKQIFAFERSKGKNKVITILNLSNSSADFIIPSEKGRKMDELFSKDRVEEKELKLTLAPWQFKVYYN